MEYKRFIGGKFYETQGKREQKLAGKLLHHDTHLTPVNGKGSKIGSQELQAVLR